MNAKANATPARVALMGFGTVGQSVARILCSGEVPQVQLTHIFNRDVLNVWKQRFGGSMRQAEIGRAHV